MKLLDRLFARKSAPAVLDSLPDFLMQGPTASGRVVTAKTALQVATVLACSRVLAEGVAQVPFKVMRQRDGGIGADPATDHPLYALLNRRPNSWMTSFEYRETIMMHLALTFNHFTWINRVRGRIVELIPLEPGMVAVTRKADFSLHYRLHWPDGRVADVPASDIWHIRGPSWNGWMGLDAVKLAREAIGLSMALEDAHARMHRDGAVNPGIYSIDGTLTPEQHDQLKKWIKKGLRSGDPMILDRAAKWVAQQMSGVDAQHLETRRYQVEEVCRGARVLPIMVGQSDKTASYASSEQMFIAHVVHSLSPWCERIEQSADVNLLGVSDDTGLYCHLDLRGLMRGALADRATYLSKALGSGGSPAWMTQDEARDFEDLNPMGGEAADLPKPTNVGNQSARPGTPPEGDDPKPADA